jgi:hypothetical protein
VSICGEPKFALNLTLKKENLEANYMKKNETDKEAGLSDEDKEKIANSVNANE